MPPSPAPPDEPVAPVPDVDPSLADWRPERPPSARERAASGALAAAMLGLGRVLEPSKHREQPVVEVEAPAAPPLDDGLEVRIDDEDGRVVVIVPPVQLPERN